MGVPSSSSSEELKVRHLCTGLQGNSLIPLGCGVIGLGSKDACSSLET